MIIIAIVDGKAPLAHPFIIIIINNINKNTWPI